MNEESDSVFDCYLGLLGCGRRPPTWDALLELTSAHLVRVPFENVSKIHHRAHLGRRWIPSMQEYLDGIKQHHFGGTCYTNNYYANLLLAHLGYQVKLCAAQIARDGTAPNGHMVSIVTVEGREAIVDVGYGAPFWFPLPRDLHKDYEVKVGRDRYVLHPTDALGCSRLEMYRDGQLTHGYLARPAPCVITEFTEVITNSYAASAMFQRSLVLHRFWHDGFVSVRNFDAVIARESWMEHHRLDSCVALANFVCEHFDMPVGIVTEVIAQLPDLKALAG